MNQITLRNLDPELENQIRETARKKGKSLNRVILEMLHEHVGIGEKEHAGRAETLRNLAGGWTEDQASAFLQSIESCEQIDEEMWK